MDWSATHQLQDLGAAHQANVLQTLIVHLLQLVKIINVAILAKRAMLAVKMHSALLKLTAQDAVVRYKLEETQLLNVVY